MTRRSTVRIRFLNLAGLVAVLLGGVTAIAACGYRFVGPGGDLPEGVTEVFAPVMVNKTSEPALEVIFTEALRERLMRAGVLGGSGSAAELDGELVTLGNNPALVRNVDGGVGYASYRVTVLLRLTLKKGAHVVAKAESSGSEDYLPDALNDPLSVESQRQAALQRLAESLVRDTFERLSLAK